MDTIYKIQPINEDEEHQVQIQETKKGQLPPLANKLHFSFCNTSYLFTVKICKKAKQTRNETKHKPSSNRRTKEK